MALSIEKKRGKGRGRESTVATFCRVRCLSSFGRWISSLLLVVRSSPLLLDVDASRSARVDVVHHSSFLLLFLVCSPIVAAPRRSLLLLVLLAGCCSFIVVVLLLLVAFIVVVQEDMIGPMKSNNKFL
ncbi:uncharacterized protein LOC127745438 [Arachis duranensis]|uniref:Uncharacterized protein LOC127745438 n=1 Tax=Arachis duranensis TaxID=130453 RepID=A0A9C6TNX0_ARADU|nr:uncharacterized protein LOC127745438 [Arachis duranensis]